MSWIRQLATRYGWVCLPALVLAALIVSEELAWAIGAVIVLWFVPIQMGGQIMAKKGRSKNAGHALGFLLGWLGVLIASCLSTDPAYALRMLRD